jgi:NOL1/NOP2/sun family putative RNA methylase
VINIPREFEERYSLMFKENYKLFLEWSLKPLKKAIRVNTLKISIDGLKERLEKKGMNLIQIPWIKEGFWVEWTEKSNENELKERFDLGNTIEHYLGFYYVQEAASMIPPLVLDPKPGELILDMAAAPGSKTTQIAQYMENEGTIVANDKNYNRTKILAMNIQRMGVTNTIITTKDARNFKYLNLKFDKILLDAPCSATGAIRKSYDALTKFKKKNVKHLSNLQRQLIATAFEILKEEGVLVYSTCSIDVEENERVVDWLLNKFENVKLEKIELEGLKKEKVILNWKEREFSKELKKTLRIMPYTNDTEGFYIAKIRKV